MPGLAGAGVRLRWSGMAGVADCAGGLLRGLGLLPWDDAMKRSWHRQSSEAHPDYLFALSFTSTREYININKATERRA